MIFFLTIQFLYFKKTFKTYTFASNLNISYLKCLHNETEKSLKNQKWNKKCINVFKINQVKLKIVFSKLDIQLWLIYVQEIKMSYSHKKRDTERKKEKA